ncbi:hypothetical protein AGMMS49928_24370 [Spirochaetia bacterium]|nr:hypothetical protein AGMMS49928_24370 [Spirochaetia bacterium]
MDLTGLLNSILSSVTSIDTGRKGLATNGGEHEGRLAYEAGIAAASVAFNAALSTANPQTMLLAEEAFVEQELQFCSEQDTHTRSSLTQALQSFEDAFLSLDVVEDPAGYKAADKTWPHTSKNRIQGFPKDAFHQACIAHRTRLHNSLRTPGINMIEKAVLGQRASNMTAAQGSYIEKQKRALE